MTDLGNTEVTVVDLPKTSHSILKFTLPLLTLRCQVGDEFMPKLSIIWVAWYGRGKKDDLTKSLGLVEFNRGEFGVGKSP